MADELKPDDLVRLLRGSACDAGSKGLIVFQERMAEAADEIERLRSPQPISADEIERGAEALALTEFPDAHWDTWHEVQQEEYRRQTIAILEAARGWDR